MSESGSDQGRGASALAFQTAAALIALVGLADSSYLTATHYAGKEVPCTVVTGCEQVLNSAYSELFGIPIAAFGSLAYFTAFSIAVLAAFGYKGTWPVFGLLSVVMAGFSLWLIYLQAFVIQAFCQFCLLSALTSILLLVIFLLSKKFSRN